ncbi:hypothetical protein FB451DRAFT_593851 [Mycena latifolia]|nr:hypothetical protein FB451DRAFT_593851 [Mycena latifolia]
MLYLFIVYLAWATIPCSAALPADAPANGAVDFGNLDLTSTPKICESACSAFTQQVDSACKADLKCLCTDKVGAALGPCVSCLAGVANTTEATTTAHFVLAQWASACNAASMPVATPSFSAQAIIPSTPSSATATASPTASSVTATSSTSTSATASSASAASNLAVSNASSASASASASGKPNHGDALFDPTSTFKAAVGALLVAMFM